MPNIYSYYQIGNTLDINLRQMSEHHLSFISFTEKTGVTEVTIDSIGVAPGVYTIYIESFDANSNVQSILKTDMIEVTVEILPQFESELSDEEITAGVASSWALPSIVEGSYPLEQLSIAS